MKIVNVKKIADRMIMPILALVVLLCGIAALTPRPLMAGGGGGSCSGGTGPSCQCDFEQQSGCVGSGGYCINGQAGVPHCSMWAGYEVCFDGTCQNSF